MIYKGRINYSCSSCRYRSECLDGYHCYKCDDYSNYEPRMEYIATVGLTNRDSYLEYLKRHMSNTIYGAKPFIIKGEIPLLPEIERVIFNGPATIVLWADGTKTIVKSQEGEIYDAEKGLAMAIIKKAYGNKGNYFNNIKKWLPKEENADGDK